MAVVVRREERRRGGERGAAARGGPWRRGGGVDLWVRGVWQGRQGFRRHGRSLGRPMHQVGFFYALEVQNAFNIVWCWDRRRPHAPGVVLHPQVLVSWGIERWEAAGRWFACSVVIEAKEKEMVCCWMVSAKEYGASISCFPACGGGIQSATWWRLEAIFIMKALSLKCPCSVVVHNSFWLISCSVK